MSGRASPARFGARALAALLALGLVAVPFGLLALAVKGAWRPLARLDDGARDDLHAYALGHDGFVALMRALSTLGGSATYWVAAILLAGWLLARRRRRLATFVAVTILGSSLLNLLVKAAVDRARPVLDDPVARAGGLSFPSGHAQAALVGYATLVTLLWPALQHRARAAAVALAATIVLAIGFSRVALGVHYVSDVVAGYALGAAWFSAMVALFNATYLTVSLPSMPPSR